MKYKLFISDFDGTLVRSDGTLSKKNIEAITKYREAGGIFAVCTGRMLPSILPRAREIGLTDGLLVAFQGATVCDLSTEKLLLDKGFQAEDSLSVLRLLENLGLHIHMYTVYDLYCNRADKWLLQYEKICGVKANVITDEPLAAVAERKKLRIVKILAIVPPAESAALRERLQDKLGERFFVTCSADSLVEVMPADQTKGEAVKFLSRYYGIAPSEIAAIGDQWNDLPMLKEAGGKFTVKNGVAELKKYAKEVASNDEDGVAEAILKYAMEGQE